MAFRLVGQVGSLNQLGVCPSVSCRAFGIEVLLVPERAVVVDGVGAECEVEGCGILISSDLGPWPGG